jgi:hypothetical protein
MKDNHKDNHKDNLKKFPDLQMQVIKKAFGDHLLERLDDITKISGGMRTRMAMFN